MYAPTLISTRTGQLAVPPAKTYYTRPRRRRWKQLVLTSWLSVGAMRDGRRRRLTAATGREVPGAGVLYAALGLLHYATPFVKNGISH